MADTQVVDPFNQPANNSGSNEQASAAANQPAVVDPFAPGYVAPRGMLARGASAAMQGLKGIGGGLVAAAGDAIGSDTVKQYGLDVAKNSAVSTNPAEGEAPQLSKIKSLGDAADYLQYGAGFAAPNALAALAAGLVGRLGGGQLAKGVANAADAMWLKNAGAIAGLTSSNIAQQVGMIYPEAVEHKADNPLASSLVGGLAAGTVGTLPETYIAARLGLLGKGLAGNSPASNAVVNALKEAGIAGSGAAVTGAAQTGIQRAAVGQSLTDDEAINSYVENAGLGAVGGMLGGGLAGALGGHAPVEGLDKQTTDQGIRSDTVAPKPEDIAQADQQPVPAEALAPSAENKLSLDIPADQMSLIDNSPSPASDIQQKYFDAQDRQKALETRLDELGAESKLPAEERRTKQEIAQERNSVLEEMGGQNHEGVQFGLAAKIKNYEALLNTPEYSAKSSISDAQILGKSDQPVADKVLITPEEHEILKQAEQEMPHAADKIEQQAGRGEEHQAGRDGRETEGSGGSDSIERAAEIQGSGSSDAAFTAKVARIKQGRGLLINQAEAKALRNSPTPEIQLTNTAAPKAVFKGATLSDQREFILDTGSKLAADHAEKLRTAGMLKSDKAADSVRSGFNKAVRDMLESSDPNAAKDALESGVLNTLKGKVAKVDAQTVADEFTSALMKQRQSFIAPDLSKPLSDKGSISLFSRAAVESDRIAKDHEEVGASATDLVSNKNHAGTTNYAVPYADREVSLPGRPSAEQLRAYTAANSDLLTQPDHALVTKFDDATQHTILNVAATTPDFSIASKAAMDAGLPGLINLRDMSYVAADGSGSPESPAVRADRFDRIMTQKGQQAADYIDRIIGRAENLEVRGFVSDSSEQGAGATRLTPTKDIIEFALNAKDTMSVAAHEGYHYLEFRVLDSRERAVVSKQFRPGSDIYERLLSKVQEYDRVNNTKLADEIRAVPAEARAYGFEFWRRGELDAPSALGRAWDKIKRIAERVGNAIQGLGFQSSEDIFSAIDRGHYARDGGNPFRTLHLDREPLPKDPIALMSRSALEDLALRSKEGEIPSTQLHGAVAALLDGKTIPEGLRERIFRNGSGELRGVLGSLKRAYLENISSGLNLARHSAGYKNTFDVLTTYAQRKSRLIADNIETRLSSWIKGASDADKRAASAALLERTVGSFKQSSPEYQSVYQRLTPKQREMFTQATDMIAHTLDQEFQAEQKSYARILGEDSEAYKEWAGTRGVQVEQLKNNGYFPERRYGDHIVHSYIETADGKKLTLYYTQHEREADARAELPQVQQAFASDASVKTEYAYKYKSDYNGTISMQQFLDVAARNGIELSQVEKERLAKALISADSTRRNRIFNRQNIAGYSDSGLRILAEHGISMANKTAYSELGGALNDAIAGKEVKTQFGTDGTVQTNVTEGSDVWAKDGEMAGFYRNLADKTADFVMSPAEGSKLSSGLRAAASIQFLGGSFAAGVVQLTSLPMNTAPWLMQHTTYTDAYSKTISALKTAVTNHKQLTDIPTLLDKSVRIEGIDEIPGLRDALTTAAQDGTTLDTEIHQIMGLARGQEYSFNSKTRDAVKAWMTPFRMTEAWNRLSTFIAAYKIAKEKNLDNDASYKLAQDAVYGTQFRYDTANRPALARSAVGALLFTFRSYPIYMTEMITHLAKEKPAAAAASLLMLGAFSGIEGMPFAQNIEDLIDTISYRIFNSPFNSKRALTNVLKSASEALVGVDLSGIGVHGLANELTGMQFASRIGLGDVVPGTRVGAADADYKDVVQSVLGPTASMVTGWAGGLNSLNHGQYIQAMQQALPLAAQNLIKGQQEWQHGFAMDAGGRKLIDVSTPEAFTQALGFSSNALAKAYDADRIDKQQLAFYQQAKQQFTTELTRAVTTGDTAKAQEVGAAIEAWNKSNPEFPLAFSADSVRKGLQLAGLPLDSRTYLQLPKTLRGSSQTAVGLVNK